MLNDILYGALRASLGSVLVENQGCRASVEHDLSSGHVTGWRLTDGGEHGEQYRVNCPFCRGMDGRPDSGHHLYVSYLSYARPLLNGELLATGPLFAHCFRRNCIADRRNRAALERIIGMGMSCAGAGDSGSAVVEIPQQDEPPQYTVSDSPTLEGIRTWVPDFRLCDGDQDPSIRDYLEGRGITPAMCRQFNIGWGQLRAPRTCRLIGGGVPFVVMPVIMGGRLRGVQARCPDCYLRDGGIRYWIHPGMRKRTVVYNLDTARQLGVGVLVEGVFDVFKVGSPGVCCFGHVPSSVQLSLLQQIPEGMILLPDTDRHADFDTVEEARSRAAMWNAEGAFPLGAHVVVLPSKDAGEMSRQAVWTEIMKQVNGKMQDRLLAGILPKL